MTDSVPKPHWDMIPGAGSNRQPCKTECDWKKCGCHFWFKLYARACHYCGIPFGTDACPVMVWGDLWTTGTVVHLACYEERPPLEDAWRNQPTVIEAAAKKQGLTIAGFTAWPVYAQHGPLLEALLEIYPDYQARIRRELAQRRAPPLPKPVLTTPLSPLTSGDLFSKL